jgi:hypothetical protein
MKVVLLFGSSQTTESIMKTLLRFAFIITLAVLATSRPTKAQDAAAKEIEGAIHQFYTSLSLRDVQGLRNSVDARFIIVAAGGANAKVGVLDASRPADLLPPEGNDDWKDVQVSSITVQVSATHPSVATASFTLNQPLPDSKITAMKAALKERPEAFTEAERAAAEKRIADRAIQNMEFAMLVLDERRWKIVSISVPH